MADQTAAVDAAAKALYESFTPAAARKQWPDVPHWTLYVFKEAALAALQAAEPHLDQMEPGAMWRVVSADGDLLRKQTRYDNEARDTLAFFPGAQLQRQYIATEWRNEKED